MRSQLLSSSGLTLNQSFGLWNILALYISLRSYRSRGKHVLCCCRIVRRWQVSDGVVVPDITENSNTWPWNSWAHIRRIKQQNSIAWFTIDYPIHQCTDWNLSMFCKCLNSALSYFVGVNKGWSRYVLLWSSRKTTLQANPEQKPVLHFQLFGAWIYEDGAI